MSARGEARGVWARAASRRLPAAALPSIEGSLEATAADAATREAIRARLIV